MHRHIFIMAMQMTLEVPVLVIKSYFKKKDWASYNAGSLVGERKR